MKTKTLKSNEKGVTLVEMLIYMGLLSILLISLTEMFAAILDVKIDSEAISSVEQDSQYLVTRLEYDINRADSISLPASPGQNSNSLGLTINGESYTYSLNGDNLELTNNAGTFRLNSSETLIQNLNIQKIGPAGKNTVRIDFDTLSKTITNTGAEQKDISLTVGLR